MSDENCTLELKDRVKWFAMISAGVFLASSTYLHVKWVFESGNHAARWYGLATLSALTTLVLGALSLPRWQSFFALAVFAYAIYWHTQPAYAIP